jgi:WD40 repeat protein
LTEKDIQFNLPTFAGRVTCMASNSVDPSILALGSGDGLIKVWKTASNKAMFEYTTIFQKGFRGNY